MNSSTCQVRLTQINTDQHPVTPPSHGALIAWLFFNISASQLLLPVLVAALFCSKPRAEPTLINVVITWILSGLVSSILLYSGHAVGCEPPPLLCLTQASLYLAIPTMTSVALFSAILQIFFNVRQRLFPSTNIAETKDHSIRRACLLVAPYIIYAIFATVIAASGAASFENTVSRTRRFFYCSVRSSFLTNTVIGFCAIVLLLTLAFAIWIIIMLRQNWARLHRSANERLDFGYIYRMLGFFFFNIIALSFALLPKTVLIMEDMTMSLMGYVVLVVFGSQETVLRACLTRLNCFYRRNVAVTSKAVDTMRMVV